MSSDPAYYLSVLGLGESGSPNQSSNAVAASVHAASDGSRLLTVWGLDEMTAVGENDASIQDDFTIEKRFHLIPVAHLLVTIPHSNDRVVLRKLDIDQAIARSEKPLLFATSSVKLSARPRQDLVHQVLAHSNKGPVHFELAAGPKGLSVSSEGKLRWRVPLDAEHKDYEVVITLSDSSGRQLFHTIRIKVE
ncbi:MAG: hypothetical protein ACP5XB_20235 [Isosphaeraceae bacterium]